MVWTWYRANVHIKWCTQYDSSGCKSIEADRYTDTFIEGKCQYNGGPMQHFTMYTQGEEVGHGRALLTEKGLMVTTNELIAATSYRQIEEHAAWYAPQ